MRVLVFHGYLLRGTGSNVYNASLAQALARMGHEVHLLCQDRDAAALRWVDRVGRWRDGELEVEELAASSGASRSGGVTAYVPEIGGLLPVYVKDRYEGFEVKAFDELTDAELERYLAANIGAVRDVVDLAGRPDAALANHLVMGPAILARSGLSFAAKIHGSALEYTVKANPDRFLPYAREGMAAASGVLVGSRHTASSLWEALELPGLEAKTRLGPPGVDTELFAPIPRSRARARLRELAEDVRGERRGAGGASGTALPPSGWDRSPDAAADAIEWLADAEGGRVAYVGKLIVSKGVDLLLAAWPLVHAADPNARLLVVGFGEYEPALRRLWDSLASGDLATAREISARGRALEGGEEGALPMLAAFLEDAPVSYAAAGSARPADSPAAAEDRPIAYPAAALAAAGSVRFAGRLEHDEVGALLPATDAVVFPSTFPEAFGMVAAEGASAGALPISAGHSGLAEVSRELAAELAPDAADLVSFPLGEGAVAAIAERLNRWLALDEEAREPAREALRETVRRRWSWERVARGVLAASAGRLGELPPVPRA